MRPFILKLIEIKINSKLSSSAALATSQVLNNHMFRAGTCTVQVHTISIITESSRRSFSLPSLQCPRPRVPPTHSSSMGCQCGNMQIRGLSSALISKEFLKCAPWNTGSARSSFTGPEKCSLAKEFGKCWAKWCQIWDSNSFSGLLQGL